MKNDEQNKLVADFLNAKGRLIQSDEFGNKSYNVIADGYNKTELLKVSMLEVCKNALLPIANRDCEVMESESIAWSVINVLDFAMKLTSMEESRFLDNLERLSKKKLNEPEMSFIVNFKDSEAVDPSEQKVTEKVT